MDLIWSIKNVKMDLVYLKQGTDSSRFMVINKYEVKIEKLKIANPIWRIHTQKID